MVLTDEQEKQVKEQLLKQLDKVPQESRAEIEKQIKSMSKEQLEEFIKKNQGNNNEEIPSCIFCAIAQDKTPSIKLDENEDSVAVLDINPISIGHTLIIPKKHEGDPNEKTQELAFSVGKKILETLQPKDITTRAAKMMDHTILNVIPIYEDTDFEKRIKTTEEELTKTAEKIIGKKLISEKIEPKTEPKIEKKEEPPKPKEPVCVFCSIAKKETPAFQIDENKENVAILEINPLSKAHTLIIPKNHTSTTEVPTNSFTLAKKIAKKIKTKYKPNDVKINPTSINNHAIIEIIPIYDNKDLKERQKLSNEELIKIQKGLTPKKTTKKATPKPKKQTTKRKGTFILPKRKYPELPHVPPRIP